MTLLKKDDPKRKWRSVKIHAELMLQPFVYALFILVAYLMFSLSDHHIAREDEGLALGFFGVFALAWSLVASSTLSSVWDKYRKVMRSVLENQKGIFLLYRDERMPIIIHLFIGCLSLPLLGIAMMFSYKSLWTGMAFVYVTGFILSMFWVTLAQLEDPGKSAWFAERVPQDWLAADIDRFFEIEGKASLAKAEKTAGTSGAIATPVSFHM